jgi:hypothetical protein
MNSHFGSSSPGELSKFQRTIENVKTLRLEEFFISLKIYWNVNVQNGLAWPIWTIATQVMAKTKVESQTGSLIPNHRKSGIDPIPLCVGSVQHIVGKLSTRATTLVQTSSWSEVYTRSYNPAKLGNSQPWQFQDSHLGVPGQKTIQVPLLRSGVEYIIWGKVVASSEFGPWWVLWVWSYLWFVLASKVLQPCVNQLVCWFCAGLFEWVSCLTFVLVLSWSSSMPFYPFKVLRAGSMPRALNLSDVSILRLSLSLQKGLGACHLMSY